MMACRIVPCTTTTTSALSNAAATAEPTTIKQKTFGHSRDIHTGRAFDELSPGEREGFLGEIESEFRKWISETRTSTGFVWYPNSRQIMRALNALYRCLADIDFSGVF